MIKRLIHLTGGLIVAIVSSPYLVAQPAFVSTDFSTVKPDWQAKAQSQPIALDNGQQQSLGVRIGKFSEQGRFYLGLQLIGADKIQMTSFSANHDWIWGGGSLQLFSGVTLGMDIASFEPDLRGEFLNNQYQIQAETALGFAYGGQLGMLWQPGENTQLELGVQFKQSTLSADVEVQLGSGLPGDAKLQDTQRVYIGLNFKLD